MTAGTVYSRPFIQAQVTTTTPYNLAVPSNYVWIVRSITVCTTVSGNTGAALAIPGGAFLYRSPVLTQNQSVQVEMRQVLLPGTTLQAQAFGTPVYFFVSGYALQYVPPA